MTFESLPLSPFDLFVVVVIGLSTLFAMIRGGVGATLSLVAWLAAFFVAFNAYESFQPVLRERIATPIIADAATAAVVFLVPLIVFKILANVLGNVMGSLLGGIDRLLGLVVGFVRGAIVVCLLYLGFIFLFGQDSAPSWIREARTFPYVERGTSAMLAYLPPDVQQQGQQSGGDMRERLEGLGAGRIIDNLTDEPPPAEEGAPPPPGQAQPQSGDPLNRLLDDRGQNSNL
ncbi:CvpA family protein [Marinivivus vitaminiproducens]|uniref:CvpA family protein n=1 Tax=Marinivivus vitaminiproducens TaxID=3035935 RepID=UPI00279D637E|nr:CvpA family protein [Geminicoccaceae bacterium SCSIO 64248]